jgi:hypothetical protein
MSRSTKSFDYSLILKAAGLVATSAAVATIVDLGAGEVNGDIVIDVTACEVASGDEIYTIFAQVSSSATFASDTYNLAGIPLGDAAALIGDTDMVEGRYILPFNNLIVDGTPKRYLRLYTLVAGTIATGINYTAYLARRVNG